MTRYAIVLLPLLLNGVAAFSPTSPTLFLQHYRATTTKVNGMFEGSGLETVDEDGTSTDPFDSYQPTEEQKEIATKDTKIGTGYTVGDSDSQLLQIKYTAKFVNGKFTANIKEFDVPSMVFKTGEQRCLPGLEEGLKGMQVGGSRKIRVPPNKGYGDNWYRGVVPPNSHLEFDCTLVTIAQNPVEEFQLKLEQFGVGRAIGASLCVAYLALSPLLEKNGIL